MKKIYIILKLFLRKKCKKRNFKTNNQTKKYLIKKMKILSKIRILMIKLNI